MSVVLLAEDFNATIISVLRSTISKEAIIDLEEYMIYKDLNEYLAEDLYSIDESDDLHPELEELKKLCDQHNASYFRLVDL